MAEGLSAFDLAAILTGAGENSVAEGEELIPVRMLNEFTYCPRLAYLEWIQGEFVDNLETREGTFGHRNVDRPTTRPIPVPAGNRESATEESAAVAATANETSESEQDSASLLPADQLAARALMLSAPSEGLIAKLDLLELTGKHAVPVDYKRGPIPDNPHQAWEPERVQLCAQGLVLRANGYTCDSGELYFIESRRRVTVPFDDLLIARTRQLVGQLRELSHTRKLPPPLIDSPKCPRCSLVGICLPDETRLLQLTNRNGSDADSALDTNDAAESSSPKVQPQIPAEPRIRKLLPARDEALPLYVQDQGAYLAKEGERLVVKRRDQPEIALPLIHVSQVALFGNVQLSAAMLRELASRGIPICHFSYGGWFHAVTHGFLHKNVELRLAQYAAACQPAAALGVARGFISAKVRNSRTLLRRHAAAAHRSDLDRLQELLRKIDRADSLETLMGLEGMAAKIYFAGFARLLTKNGDTFQLDGRNRRPPTDPVNALLSFVYALLVKELTITLQAVGFDPFLGFLHRPRYGRPSLALDLAEEFRPLIGDSVVLTLINNEEVSPRSFISRSGSVALTEAGRKAVIAGFERRLETEITHPIFGYCVSYRRILEVQARLLSRTLQGDLAEYPGFCTR